MTHAAPDPHFASVAPGRKRSRGTIVLALIVLSPLVWRAARSVDFLSNRSGSGHLPKNVYAALHRTTAEREVISFGPFVEAYRYLSKNVPENGIVAVWGVDSSERRLLTLTFNAHLFPRRVGEPWALTPYFERHPESYDERAFILRYMPSGDLPDPWPSMSELVVRSSEFEIHRLKPRLGHK